MSSVHRHDQRTLGLVAEAWFRSLAELATFITERLAAVPGIQRMETAHVLRMVRYTYDWGRPVDASSPAGRLGGR